MSTSRSGCLQADGDEISTGSERRQMGITQWQGDDIAMWRDFHGVNLDVAVNRTLLELEAPVKKFASSHQTDSVTLEQAEEVFPHLQALHKSLSLSFEEPPDQRLLGSARSYLAAACSTLARLSRLDHNTELGALVQQRLLNAAHDRIPETNPERLDQFDRGPAWSWPLPRVVAVEGLIALASIPTFDDPAILAALDLLCADPDPVVRYHLGHQCLKLFKIHPERVWGWLEVLARDPSTTVRETVVISLHRLASVDAKRALPLIVWIAENTPKEQTGADRVLRASAQGLVAFHVWKADPTAIAAVDRIGSNLEERHAEAAAMLHALREPLTHGKIEDSEDVHAVRQRAIDLLARFVRGVSEPVLRMLKQQLGGNPLKPEEGVQFESLAKLATAITSEIFFTSGAHQERYPSPPAIARPEQARFYWEADGVFDQLAAIGLPGLAHHLVETLEMYIPIDPAGVFLRVAAIVNAGRTWDYQYEDLAQGLILRIVERYLAEYRSILQQDRRCQTALRETLETFIDAGSSRAQALAYRIDEIFR